MTIDEGSRSFYRYQESITGSHEKYATFIQDNEVTQESLQVNHEFLLKSSDGDCFIIPIDIARFSKYIRVLSKPSIFMNTELGQSLTESLMREEDPSREDVSPWYLWTSHYLDLNFISSPVLNVVIQYMYYRQKYFSKYAELTYRATPGDPFGMSTYSEQLLSNYQKSRDLELHEVIPEFKIDPAITVDVLLAADFLEI